MKLLWCPSRSLKGRDLVVGWTFQAMARPARRARKLNSRTDYHRSQGLQQLPLGVWLVDCNLCVRVATSMELNVCWSIAAPLRDPGQRYCPGFGHWFIRLAWRVGFASRGIPDFHIAVSRCDHLRLPVYIPGIVNNGRTAQRQRTSRRSNKNEAHEPWRWGYSPA